MKIKSILTIALATVALCSCSDSTEKVTAAGATFPLPFYNLAIKNYNETGTAEVTYGGIGSGGGIRSLRDKVVNIAGSDAFLSEKEMKTMTGEVLHVPTCMGAVVMAYNVDGVKNINLTSDIISDIYMGVITKWDDENIVAINPDAKLPNLDITPTYRSDGSGTTFVFSDYMTKVNGTWAKELGTSKALNFKKGIAAKGNPGVAGVVKQTPGAIGYIGSEYAFALKINTAAIQNPSGEFIKADGESISAAATGDIVADTRMMITASEAKGAYPISCFTWMIIYKELAVTSDTESSANETVKFLKWMLSPATQEMTTTVHYSPLPLKAVAAANKILSSATYNGKPITIN